MHTSGEEISLFLSVSLMKHTLDQLDLTPNVLSVEGKALQQNKLNEHKHVTF